MMSVCFEQSLPGIGNIALRPLQLEQDGVLLTRWVNHPQAHFWGMQNTSEQQVHAHYAALVAKQPDSVFIGLYRGEPAFLLERYRATEDLLADYYPARPDDIGMHILVAPTEHKISGFTWAVFQTIMAFIFTDPAVARIVVEPDIRNKKVHRLNQRAGFVEQGALSLPHKTALLAFCTREQHQTALQRDGAPPAVSPLHPELWQQVNRLHLCKAIAEFSHELLLQPQWLAEAPDERGYHHYQLTASQQDVCYRFRARRLAMDHWQLDAASLSKQLNGQEAELDSVLFMIEFRDALGISDSVMATYLEEITSTLYSSAFKFSRPGIPVQQLVSADFQTIEGEMMEGHPVFVANNGRIGFDTEDFRHYAPEAAAPVQLVWIAAHRSRAHFACIEQLSYAQLLEQELGAEQLAAFEQQLTRLGLQSDDYIMMPVHPWQWQNKLVTIFAPDIARRLLVWLGNSRDCYQVQQSLRTFFNRSQPQRYYVKTALSILNMGFMRGLSPYYMATTPGINEWLHALVDQDEVLRACRFTLLREVASVGVRSHYYEQAISGDTPYKKMMAALWRENPLTLAQPGQQLMTMAALLHRDQQGKALLPALVAASGLPAQQWLQRYLTAFFTPLIHCLYRYDLMYMPHGENLILVFEQHIPQHVFMKDLAEEILVVNPLAELPEKASRVKVEMPEEMKTLTILSDVFDGVFRYMAAILDEQGDYPETRFWGDVAQCILDYQRAHPQLQAQFERYDLFTPTIKRCCLNRLQIANNKQMLNLADPSKSLQFADDLINPLAAFAP
ncbi:GNAT family N-acetyltransferase [Pseudomonas graminis]